MADRIKVHIEGKEYSVTGGSFQEMLAAVKQINGRRFMSEVKAWQLPGSLADIRGQLETSGYQLEGGASTAVEAGSAPSPTHTGSDRIRLVVAGQPLAVVGGSFQEMLAAVKSLPGRRFDGESKTWEIPGEPAIVKQLVEAAGFQLEGAENFETGPAGQRMSPSLPSGPAEPPPFEPPDFSGDDDIPPYEPPDWWDDDNMTPPPMEAPDWWEGDADDMPILDEPPSFEPSPTPAPTRGTDQIRVRVGGIPMVVGGGSFQDMLAAVKNIPGRRFDGNDKVWDIPAEVSLDGFRQQMAAAGFEVERG